MSQRADKSKLDEFLDLYNSTKSKDAPALNAVTFESVDANEDPVYHTNVICSQLRDHVMICLDAIRP